MLTTEPNLKTGYVSAIAFAHFKDRSLEGILGVGHRTRFRSISTGRIDVKSRAKSLRIDNYQVALGRRTRYRIWNCRVFKFTNTNHLSYPHNWRGRGVHRPIVIFQHLRPRTHRVGRDAIVLQPDRVVLPPAQVPGTEYFANDRVGVVQMAHGHVHLADHAQLLARDLGGRGGSAVRRPEEVVVPLGPCGRVQRAVVRRRTVVPVRVDVRVRRRLVLPAPGRRRAAAARATRAARAALARRRPRPRRFVRTVHGRVRVARPRVALFPCAPAVPRLRCSRCSSRPDDDVSPQHCRPLRAGRPPLHARPLVADRSLKPKPATSAL